MCGCSGSESETATQIASYDAPSVAQQAAPIVACDACSTRFQNDPRLVWYRFAMPENVATHCGVCQTVLAPIASSTSGVAPMSPSRSGKMKRAFECPHCDATFARSDRLLAHSRVHTGAKPFACDVCSATFSRKDRLKTHRDLHFNESPFQCGTCKRAFTQRHHLKKHEKLHQSQSDIASEGSSSYCGDDHEHHSG